MRHLVLAVVALLVGVVLGGLAMNALNKRNAYPKAVMVLMQANSMALRRAAEAEACDAETVSPVLARLHAVSGEIDLAFLDADTEEPRFRRLSQELRDTVQAQIDTFPGGCEALGDARSAIGEACKACHQVYRF
jgi:cytochrome c556